MDKDYQEEHTKTLMKLKKIADNDNIVLPSIKNSYENPTLMESKKYYNTESGLKSGKENESSMNRLKSVDEDESKTRSFYGSKYASGSNSVDK